MSLTVSMWRMFDSGRNAVGSECQGSIQVLGGPFNACTFPARFPHILLTPLCPHIGPALTPCEPDIGTDVATPWPSVSSAPPASALYWLSIDPPLALYWPGIGLLLAWYWPGMRQCPVSQPVPDTGISLVTGNHQPVSLGSPGEPQRAVWRMLLPPGTGGK